MKYFRKRQKPIPDPNFVNWNTIDSQRLIDAFMVIRDTDLMKAFFDDLMTKYELEQCIRRLQAAELILMSAPYEHIISATGLSSKIIARISKQLINKRGGFQEVMQKMHPRGMHYTD